MAYIGKAPGGTGVRQRYLYTATSGQTTFTTSDSGLALSYSDTNYMDVYQNGVLLDPANDYTATSGTSVVLGTGATTGDVIEIIVYDVFSVFNNTITGNFTVGNNLTVSGTSTLATVDINAGNIDGTTIGAATPAAGTFTTGSFTGDVAFGNNDITGLSKIISDAFQIERTNGEVYIQPVANQGVKLFWNGAERLDTTSTGIDVTGTITSDGLTVDGKVLINAPSDTLAQEIRGRSSDDIGYLQFSNNAGTTSSYIGSTGGYLGFETGGSEVMRLTGGSVGIGTTSPSGQDISANNLVVEDSSGNGGITIKTPTTSYGSLHFSDGTGVNAYRGILSYNHSDDSMQFSTNSTTAMTIDSSQRVGIGTSSPTVLGDFYKTAYPEIRVRSASYTNTFGVDTVAGKGVLGSVSNNPFTFVTNNTERMRIDSSGNVGIGDSSPLNASGYTTLSLNDTTGSLVDLRVNDGDAFRIQAQSGSSQLINIYNQPMSFHTNDTERMRIDSSGRVGIGESDPQYQVQLSKGNAGGVGPVLYLKNDVDSASTGHAAEIRFNLRAAEATSRNALIKAEAEIGYGASPALTFHTSSGNTGEPQERMRILSGGGITFNGDTAAANALDDYEEGTWTPEWQNATGVSYHERAGRYQKVGNVCHFSLSVRVNTWTSPSSTTGLFINLPFAVHNLDSTGFTACASWFEQGWSQSAFRPEALIRRNEQVVQIYGMSFPQTGVNYVFIKQDDVTNNGLWVRLQGTYQVA